MFEDERVIVWHFDLAPGESCDLHTHELDYVARIISGSTVEVFGPAGESLYIVKREPGDAIRFKVVGNEIHSDMPGSSPIPTTHGVKNVGDETFREVIVEFKR